MFFLHRSSNLSMWLYIDVVPKKVWIFSCNHKWVIYDTATPVCSLRLWIMPMKFFSLIFLPVLLSFSIYIYRVSQRKLPWISWHTSILIFSSSCPSNDTWGRIIQHFKAYSNLYSAVWIFFKLSQKVFLITTQIFT